MRKQAKELKEKINRTRKHATIKELILLLSCHTTGDYEPMKNTRLYQQFGGEYCQYLEII